MNTSIRHVLLSILLAGAIVPPGLAVRPWPDTSARIGVFADQLPEGLTEAQRAFAAAHLAGTQKMRRSELAALRAYNPDFLCLHYQLAVGCGPELFIDGDEWTSDWSYVNAQTTWFLLNGALQRVHQTAWNWYVMDLTYSGGAPNTGFPAYWIASALSRMRSSGSDGTFADSYTVDGYAFGPCNPTHDWLENVADCQTYWIPSLAAFGRAAAAAFDADTNRFKFLPNLGALVTSWDTTPYDVGHGGMIEGFGFWGPDSYFDPADWALQMDRALALVRTNKIVICQSYPGLGNYRERLFATASYLLLKGSNTYLNLLATGDVALEYYPEYEIPLLAPRSAPAASAADLWRADWGVYRRDYTHGLVLVNPGASTVAIPNLGAVYRNVSATGGGAVDASGTAAGTLAYTSVTSLTLAAYSGAVLLTATNTPVAPTNAPQPSNLAAVHRSGQTFLTWTERADLTHERYRVYRHTAAITADNLAAAARLYTVPEGSARFYANRYNDGGAWHDRYFRNLAIPDGGSELADGTGLLVWTLAEEDFGGGRTGACHYAVTTVNAAGEENTLEFAAGNTAGAVAEGVADPLPVRTARNIGTRGTLYIQYMDLRQWNPTFHAPHAGNDYYGLPPATLAVTGAVQYAYDYAVFEPEYPVSPAPAYLNLHGWAGNDYAPVTGDPEPYGWNAYKIFPVDMGETWYFGFARDHDYRLDPAVAAGDTIVNYTEQRLLRMVFDLARRPPGVPVDTNRVFVWGHSMGGSGALALALRYPNVLAAAYASEPMTDYAASGDAGGTDWRGDVAVKWGAPALNLPVLLAGPSTWADHLRRYNGTGVWDWQNHRSNLLARTASEITPLGLAHGLLDTTIEYATQGAPVYDAFDRSKRCYGGAIRNEGHTWLGFEGLPPALASDSSGNPFRNFTVVKNETVPGFSGCSADLPLPPAAPGDFNAPLEWAASWSDWGAPPLDSPRHWAVTLRATGGAAVTAAVTPRRCQSFRTRPGARGTWTNTALAGAAVLQTGSVNADALGFLTLPDVTILPAGNRLALALESPGSPLPNDYDADRVSDLAAYSPVAGHWFIRRPTGHVLAWFTAWGGAGFTPVAGDFNADGAADLAAYHEASGQWYVGTLAGPALAWGFAWGGPGFVPVSADLNADGATDLVVYHETSGLWYAATAAGTPILWGYAWGGAGFTPVAGDFNADGAADLAVYQAATGLWFILAAGGGILAWGDAWGGPGFAPVPGDFDGDGRFDQAVYAESAGAWFIKAAAGVLLWGDTWGGPGLAPVAGDFDGDGAWDQAVYQAATGAWFVKSAAGALILWAVPWGGSGLEPVGP